MLKLLRRGVVTLLLIVSFAVSLEARQSKEGTASISGRVTVAGKPARGVALTLKESSNNNNRRGIQMFLERALLEKTTTDEEGRYRFDGVAAGRYEIVPYAPSLILDDSRSITIGDGETLEDMDFSLTKGGAITGRVTGADGRPLIMEPVQLAVIDKEKSHAVSPFGGSSFVTDDRGIYRIYGLPAGQYKVSIGSQARVDSMVMSFKRPNHPQTFHPGVTDETRASIIDLAAGGEAANIDIKVGVAKKTYSAMGKVIEGATGKTIPNTLISYMAINGDDSFSPGMSGLGSPSSSTGEFRLDGLTPGSYAAFALFGIEGSTEYYSEMLKFEIKQEDVRGLQVIVHRGGSISGVAVTEGGNDQAVQERMARTEIMAMVMSEGAAPNFARSKIAEDGSFQLRGLKSGKVRLMLQDAFSQSGLSLQRVERGGVPQTAAGIDLAPDEHITDVRLVLAHASGVIRGQVNVEGGVLPKEAEVSVVARRKPTDSNDSADEEEADVDAARRFVIEGLVPGEYDVVVAVVLNPDAPAALRQVRQAREKVTVTAGSAAEVVIVLDLRK